MSFIVTANAREIDPRNPQRDDITIEMLAHSMAQINRFTGHASRPYSVAEHSLLVCEIAERELRLDVWGLFAALMHDAHEALCGDMHSPGKGVLGAPWYAWEFTCSSAVRSAFALWSGSAENRDEIKLADEIALATERAQLMPKTPSPWPVIERLPYEYRRGVAWVDLRAPERERMTWRDWRDRFEDKAGELEFGRQQRAELIVGIEPTSRRTGD